jgi:hypothetical protein
MTTERIIELKWNCNSCGSKGILGRHKVCPECGSPREKGEMVMDGLDTDNDGDGFNDAQTVSAPELIELAEAGYDWFCTHCSSGNRGNGSECSNCGSPRYGEQKELHPDLVEQPHKTSSPSPSPPEDEEPIQVQQDPKPFIFGALALLIVFVIGFFATRTHNVEGAVRTMEWSRTVTVDAWTPFTEREWRHRASERVEVKPMNGLGERAGYNLVPGSCSNEFFETERYQCGTKEESYDCSTYHTETEKYQSTCSDTETYTCGETCKSSGNGFAKCKPKKCTRSTSYTCTKTRTEKVKDPKTCNRTVPKYCTRPIYKDKCTYTSQKWVRVQNPSTSGTGKNMTWPSVTLSPLERASRSDTYRVSWSFQDGSKKDSFSRSMSETQYMTWEIGKKTYIKVNYAGIVVDYSQLPFKD